MKLFAPLLLLAATVQASILTLQSPKFTISSKNGDQLRSEPISMTQKPSPPLQLSPADTLKLSFQIVDKDNGKAVQPQQVFLRFYDEESGEEGIQPLRVASTGKVKFELNMSKPPLSLPPTSTAPLQVTLLLGSSSHAPLKVQLFDLYVPASYPVVPHPDEASFHLLPEIQHTFRPDPKLPPRFISAVFAGAVVFGPWVVFLVLLFTISPRIPRLFSPNVLPFTLSLGAFEYLLYQYWVSLKLGDVLLYGAVLGLVTLFTGRRALSSIAEKRMGAKP
ncbi:oligosaccharyl transferase delta subunit [Dendrothele bispora CBS 962.96]|uniref:Ribophorin II n=1 Tax=Dendrothele bispora (strain CBS 962.96) TaxID=1314807 RepID=A0A4S8MLY9_DENBC|nr:oligosaccharyl transferase delta subunit [Dendrothele bispora CBS 962.96]